MGMTIDDSLELFEDNFTVINTHGHYTEEEEVQATEIAIDTMRKYQQLQADYENRLKADMVAMLEDLKQDIIAESWHIECYDVNANDLVVQISDVDMVIQQKINSLKKGEEDGKA